MTPKSFQQIKQIDSIFHQQDFCLQKTQNSTPDCQEFFKYQIYQNCFEKAFEKVETEQNLNQFQQKNLLSLENSIEKRGNQINFQKIKFMENQRNNYNQLFYQTIYQYFQKMGFAEKKLQELKFFFNHQESVYQHNSLSQIVSECQLFNYYQKKLAKQFFENNLLLKEFLFQLLESKQTLATISSCNQIKEEILFLTYLIVDKILSLQSVQNLNIQEIYFNSKLKYINFRHWKCLQNDNEVKRNLFCQFVANFYKIIQTLINLATNKQFQSKQIQQTLQDNKSLKLNLFTSKSDLYISQQQQEDIFCHPRKKVCLNQ